MQLLPRDIKFYDQLLDQSTLAWDAARTLQAATETGGNRLSSVWGELREMERKAVDLEREVFRRIHKTFITPIDPEDIQAISNALARIVDALETIGFRLHAYNFSHVPERMRNLSNTVEECTRRLREVFETLNRKGLEKQEFLIELCIRLNEIENRLQIQAREGVVEAFAQESDPVQLIKLKEVYESYEAAGDRCQDVSNLIENVMAKAS